VLSFSAESERSHQVLNRNAGDRAKRERAGLQWNGA